MKEERWSVKMEQSQKRRTQNIVACRPVAKQRPRNEQLDNVSYYATARKLQQSSGVFCAVRAEML
jgi:hypothetical protein